MTQKTTSRVSAGRVVARFLREAMANLRPDDTGISGVLIWISSGEYSGTKIQHGPRVKVMMGTKLSKEAVSKAVTVRLTDPPEVLGVLPGKLKKQVLQFLTMNREVLIRYWKFEIGTIELGRLLQRV
jgi:hypothetical protein